MCGIRGPSARVSRQRRRHVQMSAGLGRYWGVCRATYRSVVRVETEAHRSRDRAPAMPAGQWVTSRGRWRYRHKRKDWCDTIKLLYTELEAWWRLHTTIHQPDSVFKINRLMHLPATTTNIFPSNQKHVRRDDRLGLVMAFLNNDVASNFWSEKFRFLNFYYQKVIIWNV